MTTAQSQWGGLLNAARSAAPAAAQAQPPDRKRWSRLLKVVQQTETQPSPVPQQPVLDDPNIRVGDFFQPQAQQEPYREPPLSPLQSGRAKSASGMPMNVVERAEVDFARANQPNVQREQGDIGAFSAGERLENFSGNLGQSLARTASAIPKNIAIAAQLLNNKMSMDDAALKDRATMRLGQWIDEWAQARFPNNPQLQSDAISTVLPQAIGTIAGYVTGSGAVAKAGGSVYGAGAVMGASGQAVGDYERAVTEGETEQEALRRAMWGELIGATEAAPIGRMLGRAGGVGRQIVHGALDNAAQGMGAAAASNVVAGRPVGEGVAEAGLMEGLGGGITAGAMNVPFAMGQAGRQGRTQSSFVPSAEAPARSQLPASQEAATTPAQPQVPRPLDAQVALSSAVARSASPLDTQTSAIVPSQESTTNVQEAQAAPPAEVLKPVDRATMEWAKQKAGQKPRAVQMQNQDGSQTLITQSAQEPGRWQVTRIDESGKPSEHTTGDDLDVALGWSVSRLGALPDSYQPSPPAPAKAAAPAVSAVEPAQAGSGGGKKTPIKPMGAAKRAELESALAENEKAMKLAKQKGDAEWQAQIEADTEAIRNRLGGGGALPRTGVKGSRPGAVDIGPLLDAAEWTVQHIKDAARWVRARGAKTIEVARELLRKTFGNRAVKFVAKVWSMAKDFAGVGQPSTVFNSQTPADPSLIKKFIAAVRSSKPIRREFEQMKEQERKVRAARISGQLGTGGRAGVIGALRSSKGEFERPSQEFEPTQGQFTSAEIDALIDHAVNHDSLGAPQERMHLGHVVMGIMEYGHLPTDGEMSKLEGIFGSQFVRALMGKKTLAERAGRNTLETMGALKALKASWDLSAVLRQGLILTVTHPVRAAKAFGMQLKAFGSESYANDLDHRMRKRPGHALSERAGLDLPPVSGESGNLSKREEQFVSKLIQRIPGLKLMTRPSERAYVTYLNQLRSSVFDAYAGWAKTSGLSPETDMREFSSAAKFINAATGRGNVNTSGQIGQLLNAAFFSPKMMYSTVEYPIRLATSLPRPIVRRMAARQAVASASYVMAVAALVKLGAEAFGWDAESELDPKSPTFGKIEVGDKTTIDFTRGMGSSVNLVAELVSGESHDPKTGKPRKVDSRAIWYYLKNKTAPVPSTVMNIVDRKRFGNKPLTAGGVAADLLAPIPAQTLQEVVDEHGGAGLGFMVPDVLGAGVNVYQPPPSKGRDRPSRPTRPQRPARPTAPARG